MEDKRLKRIVSLPGVWWATLALVSSLVTFLAVDGCYDLYDSISYKVAAINWFESGVADKLRTPGYPFILWICDWMGDGAGLALWVIQTALYCWSVVMFRRLVGVFGLGKWPGRVVMLFYILWPTFPTMMSGVCSEAPSVSLSVIMTWYIIALMGNPSWRGVSRVAVLLLVMLSIRPAFIFIPVVLVVLSAVMALKCHSKRRLAGMLTVPAIVAIGAVMGYNAYIKSVYGLRYGTLVVSINRILAAPGVVSLRPELWNEEDRWLVEKMEVNRYLPWNEYNQFYELHNVYEPARYQSIADSIWSGNRLKEIRRVAVRMVKGMSESAVRLFNERTSHGGILKEYKARVAVSQYMTDARQAYRYPTYKSRPLTVFNKLSIPFWVIFLLVSGWGCYFVYAIFRRRTVVDYNRLFLYLLVSGGYISIYVGAYADFGRLFVSTLPMAVLLLVYTLTLCFKIRGLGRIWSGHSAKARAHEIHKLEVSDDQSDNN
ncbi:MAG: hypothetical protein J6C44_08320 [Muribaculaceae bacterium]|nr:hypothetical protein [Muribaculaceae bacterium]